MLTAPVRAPVTAASTPTPPSAPRPAPPFPAPRAERGACDSVRRLVATALASSDGPYFPWLAHASLGQLHDALALAAAQLDHERWALTCLISPEVLTHLPAQADVDRAPRALALPLPVRALTRYLPEPALRRRRALAVLVENRSLRGAALGWLTASQALLAAGRFPGADAIRAHGFGRDTAAQWGLLFASGATIPALEVTEAVLHEHPRLTPLAIAGAELAVRTAVEVEHHLTAAWSAGRRAVSWPGTTASETPGVVVCT